jgi:hypothetical protein
MKVIVLNRLTMEQNTEFDILSLEQTSENENFIYSIHGM